MSTQKFRNLKKFFLSANKITDKGMLLLTKNKAWKKLEIVDLRGNLITKYKSVLCFVETGHWENFKTLLISSFGLSPDKANALDKCKALHNSKVQVDFSNYAYQRIHVFLPSTRKMLSQFKAEDYY